MLQALDFSGRSALIIGASQGIGLATAQTLASYGAKVILAARSIDKIEEAAKGIKLTVTMPSRLNAMSQTTRQ